MASRAYRRTFGPDQSHFMYQQKVSLVDRYIQLKHKRIQQKAFNSLPQTFNLKQSISR
jgi:hypothetical protein